MVKSSQPVTPSSKTLAQRVQELRTHLGYSLEKVAEIANMSVSQLEDIESGIELFLSPAVRQKLARALKTRPSSLKALEKPREEGLPGKTALSASARERYIEEILYHPHAEYPCPNCGTLLLVRLFNRRDLEDNPLVEVKAHCPNCLFKI